MLKYGSILTNISVSILVLKCSLIIVKNCRNLRRHPNGKGSSREYTIIALKTLPMNATIAYSSDDRFVLQRHLTHKSHSENEESTVPQFGRGRSATAIVLSFVDWSTQYHTETEKFKVYYYFLSQLLENWLVQQRFSAHNTMFILFSAGFFTACYAIVAIITKYSTRFKIARENHHCYETVPSLILRKSFA